MTGSASMKTGIVPIDAEPKDSEVGISPNATRNPQLFLKIVFFYVGGMGEGMEKAGSLFGVGLPLVYSVVYFSIIIVVYFSITIYTLSKD